MNNFYNKGVKLQMRGASPETLNQRLLFLYLQLLRNQTNSDKLEVSKSAEPEFKLPKQPESKVKLAAEPSAEKKVDAVAKKVQQNATNPFLEQLKSNSFKPTGKLDFINNSTPQVSTDTKVPYKVITTNEPDQIAITTDESRARAEAEIENYTKDLNQLIDTLSRELELAQAAYDSMGSAAYAGSPSMIQKDRVATLKTLLQDTIAQRDKVANAIREELDPSAHAYRLFENFKAPTLVALDDQINHLRDQFNKIDRDYRRGAATRDQVTQAARALSDANERMTREALKLNQLDRYIKLNGLPDSTEQIPKQIRDILEDVMPGSTIQENLEYIKDYVKNKVNGDVKDRARVANDTARKLPIINEEYLDDLELDILSIMRAKEYLSDADVLESHLQKLNRFNEKALTPNRSQLASIKDKDYTAYQKSLELVHRAREYKRMHLQIKEAGNGWFGYGLMSKQNAKNIAYGFLHGIYDNIKDPFGLGGLSEANYNLSIKEKIDRGEKLSAGENAYLQTLGWDAVMHDRYGSFEKIRGYLAGNITAESLRFMADFMLQDWALGAIVRSGTKQVGKLVSKGFLAKASEFIRGDVGDKMMANAAARITELYGQEGFKAALRRAAAKIPGMSVKMLGDAGNAMLMTTTLLLPKTMEDVKNLQTGLADYTVTEEGDVKTSGFTGALDFAEAARVGITRDWIENFSEMMGEWGFFSLLGRGATKAGASALTEIGLGRIVKGLTDVTGKTSKWLMSHGTTREFSNIMHKGQYHGLFGEMSEEYYGIGLNHLFGVSDSGKSFWDEVSSKDTFMDLFGGLALSQAFLGTIGVGSYLRTKHKYDVAKREAANYFGDEWDGLYNTITKSSQERLPALMDALVLSRSKKEDKDMLMRFYGNLEQFRGSSYAEQERMRLAVKNDQDYLRRMSKITGYTEGNISLVRDLRRTIDTVRPQVELVLNIDPNEISVDRYIEQNGGYETVARTLPKEQGDAVRVYGNLNAMYEGAELRITDDIDVQLDQHSRAIDRLAHDKLNEVIQVTLNNGKRGYITSGKLSHKIQKRSDDTGFERVLADGSDERLTINYSPYESEEISVNDISSINMVVQKDRFKAISTAQLANELYDQQAQDLEERGAEIGKSYKLADGSTLSVLGIARDGGLLYQVHDVDVDDSGNAILSSDLDKVTIHHADSKLTLDDILQQDRSSRSNQLLTTIAELVANTSSEDIADEEVSAGEINVQLEQQRAERELESTREATAFIPLSFIGRQNNNLKQVFSKVKQAAKELKRAATFDDFKTALRRNGFNTNEIYDDRLYRVYQALKSGKLSANNFAAIFIPENKRNQVLSKDELLRFNTISIDLDGVVNKRPVRQLPTTKQQATQPTLESNDVAQPSVPTITEPAQPSVDISMSPEYLFEDESEPQEATQPVTVDISMSPEYLFEDNEEETPTQPEAPAAPLAPTVLPSTPTEPVDQTALKIAKSRFELIADRIQEQLKTISAFLTKVEDDLTDEHKAKLAIIHNNIQDFLNQQSSVGTMTDVDQIEATSQLGESILTQASVLMENILDDIDAAASRKIEQQKVIADLAKSPKLILQPAGTTNGAVTAWGDITTTHKTSYGDSVGLENAVAEDDPALRLGDVTSKPDFIQQAKFTFLMKDVHLNGKTYSKVHVQVEYGGHKYQPVAVQTANNPQGVSFYNSIKATFNSLPTGKVIVPGASPQRTNGIIHSGELGSLIGKKLVSTTKGGPGLYIYDIEYSKDDGRFGMTMKDERTKQMYLVRPGESDSGRDTVYLYPEKDGRVLQAGTVVYLHRMPFNEITGEKPVVPIYTNNAKLTDGDVLLIIDILNGKHSLLGNLGPFNMLHSHFIENGEDKGFTNELVLNLLISYGSHNYKGKPHVHLQFDTAIPGRVHLIGNVEGDPAGAVQDRIFDLATQEDDLRKFLLERVNKNIDENFMEYRLAEWYDTLNKDQQTALTNAINRHGTLQFGRSSLLFELSDFREPGNELQSKGLSGLAWYIKRGFIQTDFDGISDALLKFDESGGIRVEDDVPYVPTAVETAPIPSTDDIDQVTDVFDIDDDIPFMDKRKVLRKVVPAERRIKREAVMANLRRILGDEFVNDPANVRLVHGFLRVLNDGTAVVGRCYRDAIILSNMAEEGVEFHEAFHRVCELLFTEKERKRAYDLYRKAKSRRKYLTDAQVREKLADEFMYYALNRPTFKPKSILKDIIAYPYRWAKMLMKIGSFRMIRMYRDINTGKYAGRLVDEKGTIRDNAPSKIYNEDTDGLDYSKRGSVLKTIGDEHTYKLLVNSLAAIIINHRTQQIEPGDDKKFDLKTDKETLIGSPIYKLWKEFVAKSNTYKNTSAILLEVEDNWEVIEPDIKSLISNFSISAIFDENVDGAREGSDNEDSDLTYEEEIASASNEEHIHDSHEFSQFSRAGHKVKWFFAGLTEHTFGRDGKTHNVLNELGLPILLNTADVFANVLNECYDVRSISEFIQRLEELGKQFPQFKLIHNRVKALYNRAYPADGHINYDAEQTLIQLFSVIRANKNNFKIVRTFSKNGIYHWDVKNADNGYTSTNYVYDWSLQFANGACRFFKQDENGQYKMRDGFSPAIFQQIYDRFYGPAGMQLAYSSYGIKHINDPKLPHYTYQVIDKDNKVRSIVIDVSNPEHVELTKLAIVNLLSHVGILFDKNMLNFMLYRKYGDAGARGVAALLQDNGDANFKRFVQTLSALGANGQLQIDALGKYYGTPVDQFFNKSGFVKDLAKYKYEYRTSHDMVNILATGGKSFYMMSENNLLSDRLSEIQRDQDARRKLINTAYVSITPSTDVLQLGVNNNNRIGSLIAKHVSKEGATELRLIEPYGMKSDLATDNGVGYLELSRREDYVQKAALLLDGAIIAPVLSDKTSYFGVEGLHVPGLDYTSSATIAVQLSNQRHKARKDGRGGYILGFPTEVLDQMIEYAICEDTSIRHALDIKDGIPNDQRVANLRDGAKVTDSLGNTHRVYQAGRYCSMLGAYTIDGTYKEFNVVKDENGLYVNEEECYKRAHEVFFDPQQIIDPATGVKRLETADELRERQREQIAIALTKLVEEELKYLHDLGLIKQRPNESGLLSYENVGLDLNKLATILMSYGKWYDNNVNLATSLGIATLVGDIVARHIMSVEEFQRIFSGTPQAFKWVYDDAGHLVDTTTDMFKRMGGLGSTGTNNVMVPGIPETYTCAEVDNEMLESEHVDEFGKLIYDGKLRSAYINQLLQERGITFDNIGSKTLAEVAEDVDAMELSEIEEKINPTALAVVKRIAKAKTDSFRKNKEEHLKGIDVADGGAYVTDKMAETLLRSVGAYNEEIRRAFAILRGEEVDGRRYTSADTRAITEAYQKVVTSVIGAQKYTAYGFRYSNGLAVPYYNKMALFPLFKTICTGKMAKVYKNMLDDGIDMLMINSAVKVGSQGSKPINWDDWSSEPGDNKPDFNDKERGFHFNTYTQRFEYLRKQFNTDPKENDSMSMGTLMKKIALSTLLPGRLYDVNGKLVAGTAVRDAIMEALCNLSDIGVEDVREMFFVDGQFDAKKFSKLITKELSDRGASAEMLDAVSIVPKTVKNSKGDPVVIDELKVPLDALANMNWLQSIIKTLVDKRVVDTRTPGHAFYQRSVWAMEGKTEVLGDEDMPPSLNNGNPLLTKNEEGSMDCVLSIDYFNSVLSKVFVKTGKKVKKTRRVKRTVYDTYEKYGVRYTDMNKTREVEVEEEYEVDEKVPLTARSFDEQKQWLIDHGIISGVKTGETQWSNATANIIGYRIPTQAISSIHALRCVDVLPVVRDTIILPTEFTKITGSDFDIDKVFLSMLYYDANGNTEFDVDTKEYWANQLLTNYLALLKDTDRSFAELNGSIDNDTTLITDVLEELEEDLSTNVLSPYQTQTLRVHSQAKDSFAVGKIGIGPYALNNNVHILAMLYGIKFLTENILGRIGCTDMSKADDRYGESISSWFSAFINAHVDVAKDPYISRANVNLYTWNVISLLCHTGLGKDTLYFVTNPVMKLLATAYNNASGVYMVEQNGKRSDMLEKAERKVLISMYNLATGKGVTSWKQAAKDWADLHAVKIDDCIEALFAKDNKIMHDIAKLLLSSIKDIVLDDHVWKMNVVGNEMSFSTTDIQMIIASANFKLKEPAQALSDLVLYTKIDTKKLGKSILEQRVYEQAYKLLFVSGGSSRDWFDTDSLKRLADDSYIGTMTDNAILTFRSILGSSMISATNTFYGQVMQLLSALGLEHTKYNIQDIQKALLAYIKSEYFFGDDGFAARNNIDPNKLFYGDNNIYNRLLKIKALILNDPAYKDLKDNANGEPRNYLLRNLVSGKKFNTSSGTAAFVRPLALATDDSVNEDEMCQAWSDLLNDTSHPDLQQFAKDLIVYSFMVSGDNGGGLDIFRFIPVDWKLGLTPGNTQSNSYALFIRNKLDEYRNQRWLLNQDQLDDIVLNNFDDNRFIPNYSKTTFEQWMPDQKVPVIIGAISNGNATIEVNNAPRFIKRYAPGGIANNGRDKYYIYKLVSIGVREKKVGDTVETERYPIYALVDGKGNSFDKRTNIFEYNLSSVGRYEAVLDTAMQQLNNTLKSIPNMQTIMHTNIEEFLSNMYDWAKSRHGIQSITGLADPSFNLLSPVITGMIKDYMTNRLMEDNMSNVNVPISNVSSYSGDIIPEPGRIMVFGSNTQGRHGAGSAKQAALLFGAKYGLAEGMQGQSYAIITKDLTAPNKGLRSISRELIIEGIKRMYETARNNPDLVFDVAYRNMPNEYTLNGYNGKEMMQMFIDAAEGVQHIPVNVRFSEEWVRSGSFDITKIPAAAAPIAPPAASGTYAVPQQLNAIAEQVFGRKTITPSNKLYITENVQVKIGNRTYSQKELEQFLSILNQIADILFGNSITNPTKDYVRIPYAEWKRLLDGKGDNAIGVFVENRLEDVLDDGDWIDTNDENFLKYDKNTKTIIIPKIEYEIVRILYQNPEYIEFLNKINPNSYAENIMTIERTKYQDVGEMIAQLASNVFEEGFKNELDVDDLREDLNQNDIHIKYSYSDSRQLTLWDNSDEFSDEEMNHCPH